MSLTNAVELTYWAHGDALPIGFCGEEQGIPHNAPFLLNLRVPGASLREETGTMRHTERSGNWLQLTKKKGKEIEYLDIIF